MLVLFVAAIIAPISDVKAATPQDMSSCSAAKEGCEKAKECDKDKECDKAKEGCDAPKEGCDKSAARKAGCSK